MAEDTLIRVIQAGFVREYKLKAILGAFWERIEKAHGVVEIQDNNLETKLTKDEQTQLYAKFPYLNPNRPLPPKPKDEPVAFRSPITNDVAEELAINDIDASGAAIDEETELRAKLDAAGIKHGTIKKIETLRNKVKDLK